MARRDVPVAALLAHVPLFKALDAATLSRLADVTSRRALKRGEALFRRGEPAAAMYVVVHGEIKLVSTTASGGERLTGIVGPGQSFGEPVMFLERPTVVDARSAGEALVLELPKQAVFTEIERNPKFARRMIAGLSKRVEALVRELERQAIGSGRARFIAYLLRHDDGASSLALTLPAAKAEIASQLNLTPEHFSRILHDLVDAGVLQVQGRRITVPDTTRLHRAAAKR